MPTDKASYEIDYNKSAVPYASVQSAPFKLRSGNTSAFKMLGSSPAKIWGGLFGGGGGTGAWLKNQVEKMKAKREARRNKLFGAPAVAPGGGGGDGAHTHGTGGEPIGGTQAGMGAAAAAAPEMPAEGLDEEIV